MNRYEVMFILDPKEEGEALKKNIKNLFQEHGSEIYEEKELGLKKMAYSIQKKDKGFYYTILAGLEPAKNEKLKRELNLKEAILRYMFVKLETFSS